MVSRLSLAAALHRSQKEELVNLRNCIPVFFAAAGLLAAQQTPAPKPPAAQQRQSEMKNMDAALQQKLAGMNAATGQAKIDAMASVINELVSQRIRMQNMMMQGQGMGMGMGMGGMRGNRAMRGGMGGGMQNCPCPCAAGGGAAATTPPPAK